MKQTMLSNRGSSSLPSSCQHQPGGVWVLFQQLLGAGPACPGTGLGLMGQVGTREGPCSRRCRLCAGGAGDVPKEAAGCYDTVCRSNVCAERSQNHLYKRSIPGLGGGRIYLQCLCKAEELQGEDARGNNASLPPGAGAEPGADPLVCMGKGHGSNKGSGSFKQAEPCWISHPTRQICTVKETAGSVQTGARCCLGKQPLLHWTWGHLAHGMGWLTGASSARHELKHPEPEARSEVSRAPPALACILHPCACRGTAGAGSSPCMESDFPSRKRAGLCRGRSLVLLCWIPLLLFPGTLQGQRAKLGLLPLMGARGAGAPAAAARQGAAG